MDWYEAEVADLIERLAARPLPAPTVFYGSSTIRLWDTLARDVGSPRAVNAGFGGSTLAACAHFFERIVPPLQPVSLVLYAGDNDLGDGRSPEDVLASYRDLAARIDARCGPVPFAFVSIKPSPARRDIVDRIRRANELVRSALDVRPGAYYIDVFDAMLEHGEPRPELYLADGLHLSRAGYDLWSERLEPFHHRMFPNDSGTGPAPEDDA
jgi:lysophospholipase L1-like esterase